MESLDTDLRELLTEFAEVSKTYSSCQKERDQLKNSLTILRERLKVSEESEARMRSKLQEKQNNISELLKTLNELMNIKDENEHLKDEIKTMKDQIDSIKKDFSLEKEKWFQEKDDIIKANREEIENLKKIRNMEVSSLNREIDHIQEENNRKIELVKREVENYYGSQLSSTRMDYEDKLSRLTRDLITAQSEVRHLRQSANEKVNLYNQQVIEEIPTKERHIPQPLSFARYKPLIPIVTSASQMYKENFSEHQKPPERKQSESPVNFNSASATTLPSLRKKKKLYSKTEDYL